MIIRHNASVSYINKTIKFNNLRKSKSISKLSSGYRINSASDDAAGLSISEKMRAQIRGLNQAARNAQDGISLIQVAQEGLSNILEPPLQRLRELAVQASNGTLTDEDRMMVQNEADQLIRSIDEISRNTHFNGIKLLNGDLEKPSLSELIIKVPLSFQWDISYDYPKKISSISPTDDGGFIIGGTTDESASHHEENDRSSWVVKFDANGEVQWETIIPKEEEYNGVYDIKQLDNGGFILTARSNRIIGSDALNNEPIVYRLDSGGNIINKVKLTGGNAYLFSIKEAADGGFVATGTSSNRGILVKFDSNLNITKTFLMDRPSDSHFKSGLDVKETSDGGFIIAGEELYPWPDQKGFVMKLDSNFNLEWETKIDDEAFQSVVEEEEGNYIILGKSLYSIDAEGNSKTINSDIGYVMDEIGGSQNYITVTQDNNYLIGTGNKVYKVDSNGNELWSVELEPASDIKAATQINDGGYVIIDGKTDIVKFQYDIVIEQKTMKDGLYLQTGANSGQGFHVYIEDSSSKALGIKNINMRTQQGSQAAISLIDDAISFVSLERSKLGGYNNRLEHAVAGLGVSLENLQAAESRIRDSDAAEEVLELAKRNILQEVSIALMSQANNSPKAVLQLLES